MSLSKVARMRNPLSLTLALAAFVVGCSSSSDSTSTPGTDAGDGGSSADVSTKGDPLNCQPPGSKPNEKGMGGYCSPAGHECDTAGPGGEARLCTADIADTPVHAWFCTYPCSTDADCGSASYCQKDPRGSGCVPTICKSLAPDAGPETSSDAVADGG